jgi:ribosome maturation factor RimP
VVPHADDALPAEVRQLAAPLADDLGVDVLDVEVKGQRGRRLVKLVADARDQGAGLDVDTIATLSRQIGDALDEHDVIPGRYTLEVTSPGVNRPLREGRDFARNVGRQVRLLRKEGLDDPLEVTGTVLAVDELELRLEVDGVERRVPLDEVAHGKVVLPW